MRPNGCYNRADYAPVILMQDGWIEQALTADTVTRIPRMVPVKFKMSNRCEYTATSKLGQADPRCVGCSRRAPKLDDLT